MSIPLAEKLRPQSLEEFIGQIHLVGEGKPLKALLNSGQIQSLILWGPPGSGKTTLARLVSKYVEAELLEFSAVSTSIKDIKIVIENAKRNKNFNSMFKDKKTIIFIDEIHRFNKAQQDAFLPYVENGTIILIGATTENPGFEVNAPLISRSQVYRFNKLSDEEIKLIITRALKEFPKHKWSSDAIDLLINYSDGDARKAINSIELVNTLGLKITREELEKILQRKAVKYDKKGDSHYDTISAFIKSMRGSQTDATMHYLARMIYAGEDPVFISRRMLIFAAEDIGIVNPMALVLATSTMQAVQMIGMPEAQIILAECAAYLSESKKSVASYFAINEALSDIERLPVDSIPFHLRNSVNSVVEKEGYGKNHVRYPWMEGKKGDEFNEYLPENLKGKKYFDRDLSEKD